MLLQNILKTLRTKNGYTQEQIAKKLFISTQAVSKWENGSSIPAIDNLLALSDLYNISLDELVQGSPFFKKPYLVGNKINFKKGFLFVITWLFICLLFTGFGYQPFWLLLSIFIIGILLVFPTIFNDYWVIENDGIRIKTYSKKNLVKLTELITHNQLSEKILYADITSVELIYKTKQRVSPFDISFDSFYLQLWSKNGEHKLIFDTSTKKLLPQFAAFLNRQKITVIDDNNIVELLISGKSLYEVFNKPKY